MNKLFLVAIFLSFSLFNVEALRKKKVSNTNTVSVAIPPPDRDNQESFLEGETSSFELKNFYEYVFYVRAYELYNNYALNSGLCGNTYFTGKKLDAISTASFCRLIGGQISSSYLSSYLCAYIQGTATWFSC